MKILKVYDKINRNIISKDPFTGSITIFEYNEDGYCYLIINTKVFSTKSTSMAYFSYRNFVSGVIREELDITHKYVQFKEINEKGFMIQSQRFHIKDPKSFLEKYRIYDDSGEFIEIENYKGKRTINFKVKNDILINFLNLINNGKQED